MIKMLDISNHTIGLNWQLLLARRRWRVFLRRALLAYRPALRSLQLFWSVLSSDTALKLKALIFNFVSIFSREIIFVDGSLLYGHQLLMCDVDCNSYKKRTSTIQRIYWLKVQIQIWFGLLKFHFDFLDTWHVRVRVIFGKAIMSCELLSRKFRSFVVSWDLCLWNHS